MGELLAAFIGLRKSIKFREETLGGSLTPLAELATASTHQLWVDFQMKLTSQSTLLSEWAKQSLCKTAKILCLTTCWICIARNVHSPDKNNRMYLQFLQLKCRSCRNEFLRKHLSLRIRSRSMNPQAARDMILTFRSDEAALCKIHMSIDEIISDMALGGIGSSN